MEMVDMELDDGLAISVSKLSIIYRIRSKKLIGRSKIKEVKALDKISFQIKKGELVAVLGKNGSGKTTLLGAIGGHLRPESGTVNTCGRVYTLRGANPGLVPHISSRENIRMMSQIYGVPNQERVEFEKQVEEFCDLGEAYDRDYSSLSSGMAGRVGFGFTTSLTPEILLMDETLGVGDVEFRKKAEKKAMEFMEKGETILLSTHSLNLAKTICKRGLVLDKGELVFDGPSEDAVDYYLKEIIK
jgi:ABC-type polysaccharide/polyol phosphate transport system ATPase subunit